MWQRARPDAADAATYLAGQRDLPFSYAEVGHSLDRSPAGYTLDHSRRRLGAGETVFARARAAVREWRMFPPGWTAIEPRDAPIATGAAIAVLIRALGVWWLNAARIVYVIDEPRRFGFAYGTLPGHAERGEERFSVEWGDDDQVWYDLRAFSQPRHWAARLGHPITRALQRRFARHSMAAMEQAVVRRGGR